MLEGHQYHPPHLGLGFRDLEMCSGSEEGSYARLIDCVYHSTLGLRVIKRQRLQTPQSRTAWKATSPSSITHATRGVGVQGLGIRPRKADVYYSQA